MSRFGSLLVLCSIPVVACSASERVDKARVPSVDSGAFDSGPPAAPDTGLGTWTGEPEECNGLDDDGDGAVDEGFTDTDDDGVADCVDTTCDVETAEPVSIPVDSSCVEPDIRLPLELDLEWQWSGSSVDPTARYSFATPLVGHLHDSNSDGVVDTTDHPTVVISAGPGFLYEQRIFALDGVTGEELWSVTGRSNVGSMMLADVDADGWTDVVFAESDWRVTALRGDGSPLWRSDAEIDFMFMFAPAFTAADLDQDGQPEVIAMNLILDGATGALRRRTPGAYNWALSFWSPWTSDLDGDGFVEIVLGDTVYDHEGNWMWTASIGHVNGCWSAPLDADGDGDGDVVMLCGGRLGVYEADGTVIREVAIPGSMPGPSCAADFDGDGQTELAFATFAELHMMELDGTLRWTIAVQDGVNDPTMLAGCSAFDADRNGTADVLYAGERALWILDGATGVALYENETHGSDTLLEYPVVADVDLDGEAELLVASNDYRGGWAGLTVLGHRDGAWPSPGSTWHTHAEASTGIAPDGSVEATPTPSWQVDNAFRARQVEGPAPLNLRPRLLDACVASCASDGVLEVALVVDNDSGADLTEPVDVKVSVERDGVRTLLATEVLTSGVPQGSSTASVLFRLPIDTVEDADLVFEASVAAGVRGVLECDLTDNELVWRAPVCP